MPATKVPWPSPSPGEFGVSDVMIPRYTSRSPSPAAHASTPESTTAIAGADVSTVVAAADGQSRSAPRLYGHSCELA